MKSGKDEYNRFRAFSPFPSVFLNTTHGRIKIKECRGAPDNHTPGKVVSLNPLTVSFVGTSLALITIQPEGKPAMSGAAWALGRHLSVGDQLV
jgi:methionyl-tRNA formyltransferase